MTKARDLARDLTAIGDRLIQMEQQLDRAYAGIEAVLYDTTLNLPAHIKEDLQALLRLLED